MCEKFDLPGGGSAIICGGRHSARYCACGRAAVALCDWKVPAKPSGTCDAPICERHAKQVARGKHLCPLHQQSYERWLEKHPPAQRSLFEGNL